MTSIAQFAEAYTRRYNLHLVPLKTKSKLPIGDDWGKSALTDPAAARAYYETNPDHNLGVALGPSRLCSFDVDDLDATRMIFEEFGWNLDELIGSFPTVQGQPPGCRIMFHVPDGVTLPYHSLTWPKKEGGKGRFTVWEIRSADDKQRQDVLPPSIHPDTGKPYVWLTKPNGHFPEPPEFLLQIWRNWDKLKPQFQAVCPWAEKPTLPERSTPPVPRDGESVIEQFIAANDLETSLERYGYKRMGRRWLSPHSGTGLPGVNIFKGASSCWIHHASDPLCSEESGQPVNVFDLFCCYEHNGDVSKAVRAAADMLGIKSQRKPPARRQQAPSNIDMETGEIIEPPADAESYIDTMTFLPDTTDKGKPLATIENIADICNRLGVRIRYNIISKEEEILIPRESFSLDNKANASFAWLTSWCARFRMPTDKLSDFVTYIADQNLYNPVTEWIKSRPWDGTTRLQQLYDTIASTDDEFKSILIRRWLISAIAAAFNPNGVSAHGVLVLQGAQYLGKTKWFKSLVPDDLGLVKDGMILRPDDKDSVKQACSFWLVELGELDATFRKSDIAQLKSFITNQSDVLRRAYARKESHFARRTVFFGSVNPKQFLHDPTGNRRFWTIECDEINHSHNIDMQQLWAEVLTLYQAGESHYLTPDEMLRLNNNNESFQVADPVEDRLSTRLAWDADHSLWSLRTSTDVLISVGMDKPTQSDCTKAANFIRKRNGNNGKRSNGKNLVLVPPVL